MSKPLIAKLNSVGGYDLLTERDTGNEILILTGKASISVKYWERLHDLCKNVIQEINHSHPIYSSQEIKG